MIYIAYIIMNLGAENKQINSARLAAILKPYYNQWIEQSLVTTVSRAAKSYIETLITTSNNLHSLIPTLLDHIPDQMRSVEEELDLPSADILIECQHMSCRTLTSEEQNAINRVKSIKRFYTSIIKLIFGKYNYNQRWSDIIKLKKSSGLVDLSQECFYATPFKALKIFISVNELENCNGVPFTLGTTKQKMKTELFEHIIDRNPRKSAENIETILKGNLHKISQERTAWSKTPIIEVMMRGGRMDGHTFKQESNIAIGVRIRFDPDFGLVMEPLIQLFDHKLKSQGGLSNYVSIPLPLNIDYSLILDFIINQIPDQAIKSVYDN